MHRDGDLGSNPDPGENVSLKLTTQDLPDANFYKKKVSQDFLHDAIPSCFYALWKRNELFRLRFEFRSLKGEKQLYKQINWYRNYN